jgi:hypothetical protein
MTEPADVSMAVSEALVREILEAICERDGISLESNADPGQPARNYELALRLGIGHVLGLKQELTVRALSPEGQLVASLLGKRVKVTLSTGTGWSLIEKGTLLGYGDGGDVQLLCDDGLVHHCWPRLHVEEIE